MDDSEFWMSIRVALLNLVDIVERSKTNVSPRTAELRKMYKRGSLNRAPTDKVGNGSSDRNIYRSR